MGDSVEVTGATEVGDAPAAEARREQSTQSWGALLLLSPDWRIDGASANAGEYLGVAPDELLGRPMASILSPAAVHAIRNRFALLGGSGGSERLFGLALSDGGRPFDLLLRLAGSKAVVEVFPAADTEGIDVAAMVARMAGWIDGAEGVSQLGERAAHAVRGVTGCDSVSIWKARGAAAPQPIACYARTGFECPPAPRGALPGQVQFVGACRAEPQPLLLRDGARPPDFSESLLASDVSSFRDYVCSNNGASGFLQPVMHSRGIWGWITGLHRHERSIPLARLSVLELFARLLASEVRRLEP